MPFQILDARFLAPAVKRFLIAAPHVTRHCQPGQFVIIRVTPTGERIPLTIAASDKSAGTITLIAQAVGASTTDLCSKNTGDSLSDVAGPMGRPTHLQNVGHAVIVGGGVGTAVIFPQALGLKQAGNRVSAIIGGRSKEYVILEKELAQVCDAVYPCTDDGSYGFKGFVTQRLEQLIQECNASPSSTTPMASTPWAPPTLAPNGSPENPSPSPFPPIKIVLAAGPVPMMRAVAETTRPHAIQTVASLNPIMVDGTGMCGGCRIQVAGQMKFACVDGPEFDAHQVDFKELSDRLTAYKTQEKTAMDRHACKSQR